MSEHSASGAGRPGKRKKRYTLLTDMARNPASYLLAFPAILYTFLFSYMTYPYLIIAFQKFNYKKGIFNSDFVGFENFKLFVGSNDVYRVIFNTVWLNLLFIVFGTAVSIAIAVLLNEISSKWFVKISQSVMLLPNYLSWVIVSYILYSLFSTDYGLIDKALRGAGIAPVNWYSSASYWPSIITVTRILKGSGMNAVIFLAAITGIDATFYEAASLDGASRWQQCRYITLPLMMPTVVILTLLSIGRIMFGDFGMIYALIGDNGVLYPTTDIIDTYIFRALRLTGNPSQATAIGLFQSVIGFVMVFGTNWITRRYYSEGAIF